jgi:putative copper export protein
MKSIAAALLAGLLVGCATGPEYVWVKPNSTENEFYNDLGQCRAQAFGVSGVTLMQAVLVQNNCLMGKGWRQAPKQQANCSAVKEADGGIRYLCS